MHDTLKYIGKDPVYRKHHHNDILFGLHYAFSENFILPLSHDEVVHGKGSIIGRMPGDDWQRFANLRAYFSFMFGHPGKKLLFMGGEFGQEREWNHDHSLDWHLLGQPQHAGVQNLVRDLNRLYRSVPALHEIDCNQAGFEWVITHDSGRQPLCLAAQGLRRARALSRDREFLAERLSQLPRPGAVRRQVEGSAQYQLRALWRQQRRECRRSPARWKAASPSSA